MKALALKVCSVGFMYNTPVEAQTWLLRAVCKHFVHRSVVCNTLFFCYVCSQIDDAAGPLSFFHQLAALASQLQAASSPAPRASASSLACQALQTLTLLSTCHFLEVLHSRLPWYSSTSLHSPVLLSSPVRLGTSVQVPPLWHIAT